MSDLDVTETPALGPAVYLSSICAVLFSLVAVCVHLRAASYRSWVKAAGAGAALLSLVASVLFMAFSRTCDEPLLAGFRAAGIVLVSIVVTFPTWVD